MKSSRMLVSVATDMWLQASGIAREKAEEPDWSRWFTFSQIHLRRSISTAYYALFWAVSANVAHALTGADDPADANWLRVFRQLDHKEAEQKFRDRKKMDDAFESSLADTFVEMKQLRLAADYDPSDQFDLIEIGDFIDRVRDFCRDLDRVPTQADRDRAIDLLFRKPKPGKT